ncbi:carbohydrate deacetylase [Agromyces seonyuensis]|uniref:ChbG/HpnK family deacetylase n=1 Tax=Agromyces seonyuensis TaxID=2662446 RepID=A0A6I4NX12_9MICO|nr:ChbG/HpnK family deacetylase [Agromyces seonyuensis]MWB98926.1 ChbG/HpnK family deacetylase [Agromyces seonyuensis]
MTRRLVVTADDLGRERAGIPAILALAADGCITATTAIVVGEALTADDVATLRAIDVEPRLHATLTGERGLAPWRPVTQAPSLVDAVGALPAEATTFAERAAPGDVAAELAAQLERLRSLGARPTAMDSHAGTLYGLAGRSFLPEALALCAREGLGFRLPRRLEPYLGVAPGALPAELADAHRRAVEAADAAGVPIPAAMLTNRRGARDLGGYGALFADVARMLAGLPEGTSELFLHPAPDGALVGDAGVVRAWELRLLRDPAFRSALDAEGFELVEGW